MSISRLMLGCAKFGLDNYPPGSGRPKPSRQEAIELIRYAYSRGIRAFDTAAAYGEADFILAEALDGLPADVTTKRAPENIYRCPYYWPILIHNPLDFPFPIGRSGGGLADGVSVGGWGPDTDRQVASLARGYGRHIQIPYWLGYRNLLDAMAPARAAGMKVYARQPYGRGQLVCREALWFSLASPADYVVFGAANREQLDQTLDWAAMFPVDPIILPSVCTRR